VGQEARQVREHRQALAPRPDAMTTARSARNYVFAAVLLCCVSAKMLNAEAADVSSCFRVHVRLNGKSVAGPQVLTFKTKKAVNAVTIEAGCFTVPVTIANEKEVDVLFTVPGNSVYLSSINVGFLVGYWDVDLEDKHFNRDVILPAHARTKNICAVAFHAGEPETAITQSPCRTPFQP
jgi:hypothetical protein